MVSLGTGAIDLYYPFEAGLCNQVLHNTLSRRRATDVAEADKANTNQRIILLVMMIQAHSVAGALVFSGYQDPA
jgi:hypothetical protein